MQTGLRVSVAPENFKTEFSLQLDNESTKLLFELLDVCGITSKYTDVAVADSACVQGPGWKVVEACEADKLSRDVRRRLVPLRDTSKFGMISEWTPSGIKLVLSESSESSELSESTSILEIESLAEESGFNSLFNVFHCASRERRRIRLPAPHGDTLFLLFTSFESPGIFPEVDSGPARPLSRRLSDALPQHFAIPALVGEVAIRFFSQQIRVHVLVQASLKEGMKRQTALNDCMLSRLPAQDGGRKPPSTKLFFSFHSGSCECLCSVWNPGAVPSQIPSKKVGIALDFCGCKLVNGCCPVHSEKTVKIGQVKGEYDAAVLSAVCGVCMCNLKLSVLCSHSSASSTCRTRMPMPSNHPFLPALAACCSALCDFGEAATEAQRNALFDVLMTPLDNFECPDAEMIERDEATCSMLASRNFFFGSKKKGAKPRLHYREESRMPPVCLTRVVETHSHLLPPK